MAGVSNENCDTRRVVYVVSEDLAKISSLLPSNRGRSILVHSLLNAFGFFREENGPRPVRPVPAQERDLMAYHDKDYIEYVLGKKPGKKYGLRDADEFSSRNADFGLEDDCPLFPGLPQYVSLVGGASLTAARTLRDDEADIAICWDGGRHHAHKSRASGFCYVADVVLSILTLKRATPRPRIMYIDLDLHFCDGVSEAFHNSTAGSSSPQILTISIHHASRGFFPSVPLSQLTSPDTEDPFTLSIPLERGASNETFHRVWLTVVEKVRDAFDPTMVIVQCGADGLAGDPCATFNWGLDAKVAGSMGWCLKRVFEWNVKVLLFGGGKMPVVPAAEVLTAIVGGYNSANAARAWTYLTALSSGIEIDADADIPEHRNLSVYAPSFTLDVPIGNMRDENSSHYLDQVESVFQTVATRIREKVHSH